MSKNGKSKTSTKEPKVTTVPVEEKKCDCGCGGKDCKCGCYDANEASRQVVLTGVVFALILIAFSFFAYWCGLRTNTAKGGATVAVNSGDKAAVEAVVANYIKSNPEAIIASLDDFYAKQQRQQQQGPDEATVKKVLSELLADKTNLVLGNPKGTFVMVEFFDYQCHFCKDMNKIIPDALKKSDNIRWVLMPSPIFGEKSETIARYAIASAKQGKLDKFHNALESQKDISEAGLKELAKKLGMDADKLQKDADSKEVKDKLAKIHEYAAKLNVRGVPMFIINGGIQPGAFPKEQLDEYVKEANAMKK